MKEFSIFEQRWNTKHPLLCSFITSVLAGIISGGIVAGLGWGVVKSKPVYEETKPHDKTYSYRIKNEGILPANINYTIVSQDTAIIQPVDGREYVSFEDVPGKTHFIKVLGLPEGRAIRFNVIGSDVVTMKKE